MNAGVTGDGKWSQTPQGTAEAHRCHRCSATSTCTLFDLWAHDWRRRHARGDVVVMRFADDITLRFEHEPEARRFLAELRERFTRFGMELAGGRAVG